MKQTPRKRDKGSCKRDKGIVQKRQRDRAKRTSHKRKHKSHRLGLRGGKAIASGQAGCVFRPALKCEGDHERPAGTVSKLGFTDVTEDEWNSLAFIKDALTAADVKFDALLLVDSVITPNRPQHYMLLPHQICNPAELNSEDLWEFDNVCDNFNGSPYGSITSENVNVQKALQLKMLQIRDGGLTLDGRFTQKSKIKSEPFWKAMIELLANGIVPLNTERVLHNDIKYNNVVYDDINPCVRLIDWNNALTLATEHRILSVVGKYTDFRTAIQQPIAYGFLCRNAFNVMYQKSTKGFTQCKLYSIVNRLHLNLETNAQTFAGLLEEVNIDDSIWKQIGAILDKFWDERTSQFDYMQYANLLARNLDVWGWLSLVNFCFTQARWLFADCEMYPFYTGQTIRTFLLKYMYSVEIITEPYNIHNIINEIHDITTSTIL